MIKSPDPNDNIDMNALLRQLARESEENVDKDKIARTPFKAIAASAAVRTGNAPKVLRAMKSVNISVDVLKKYEYEAQRRGETLHRLLQERIENKYD